MNVPTKPRLAIQSFAFAAICAVHSPTVWAGDGMPGDVLWSTSFGGTQPDFGEAVAAVPGGGFIVAGTTASSGGGFEDAWLLRLDVDGALLWSRTIGAAAQDFGTAVAPTSDGGFVVAGSSGIQTVAFNVMLAKTDAAGTLEWQRSFSAHADSRGHAVRQLPDDGYVVVGDAGSDFYIIRTDAEGIAIWERTIHVDDDHARAVALTDDGGFVVAGWIGDGSLFAEFDAALLKVNAAGDLVWQRQWDEGIDHRAYSVQNVGDGYVVGGQAGGVGSLWRTDALGNRLWIRTLLDIDAGNVSSVEQAGDGGFVAGATAWRGTDGAYQMQLIKTDALGQPEWSQVFGGAQYEWTGGACTGDDGRLVLAGTTNSIGAGGYDIYVFAVEVGQAADIDDNGVVDVQDLLAVVVAWGPCDACAADVNGDGLVGIADLVLVISAWTG